MRTREAARGRAISIERSALDLIGAILPEQQSLAVLEQTLDEQIVQVSTLVGAGLPPLAVRSLQDGRT